MESYQWAYEAGFLMPSTCEVDPSGSEYDNASERSLFPSYDKLRNLHMIYDILLTSPLGSR